MTESDFAALSPQEVSRMIHSAMMTPRDEAIDNDELELLLFVMSDLIHKLQNHSAIVITHERGISPEALHIMHLMRINLGHFAYIVRNAREALNGKAAT